MLDLEKIKSQLPAYDLENIKSKLPAGLPQPSPTQGAAASVKQDVSKPLFKTGLGEKSAQLPSSLDGIYETAAKTIDGVVNLGAKKAQEREAERAKIREAINSDTSLSAFEKERRFLEENRKLSALNTEWLDKMLAKQDPTQESEFVKHLNQRQAEARQKLKEGMNTTQSFLTDAALSGADMASMAATAAATGVPFLALTGLNTGAEAAQKALSEGYSADKALAYGAGSGAITAGIESFGGIAGSWGGKLLNTSIGKSVMGKLPQKAVDYVAKVGATKLGQILGDAGSEGLEEFGEYYAQNLFENILLDKDTPADIKEALYNAGVGSVVGGVFGGGKVVSNSGITNPVAAAKSALGMNNEFVKSQLEQPADVKRQTPYQPIAQSASTPSILRPDYVANQFKAQADTKHTPEMQKTVADYKNAVDDGIVRYANDVRNGRVDKKTPYPLGVITDRAAQEIQSLTGLDVRGNSISLMPQSIVHIDNRHGKAGSADHSMADDTHLARIKYVLDNYDTVKLDPTKAKGYSTKNGKPAPKLVFSKRINGTYYVVEAVSDSSRKTNFIISAYLQKADSKKTGQQPLQWQNAPKSTSETSTASPVSNPTVPQGTSGVNTSISNNSDFDTFVSDAIANYKAREQKKAEEVGKLLPKKDSSPFGPNTVGAAEHNPKSFAGLQTKHGVMDPGEKPARIVDMPKKNADNQPISQAARTIMEAGITSDAEVKMIERMIENGELTKETITDKSAMSQAVKTIEYNGWENAVAQWNAAVSKGRFDKNDIALGQMIYNQAVQNKDVPLVKKMIVDLTMASSDAGRNLQATRMLKKLTPDGKLYGLEQSVRKINQNLFERYGEGKFKDIEIPTELAAELLNSSGGVDTDVAISKIEQHIANQIPSTFMDKWNAWRYLAMLGNPRTHIRNIIGNAMFAPAVKAKNLIANGLETSTNTVLRKFNLKEIERTKAITFDKNIRNFAKSDFKAMESSVRGDGKYNPSNSINDKRRIFKNDLLEGARKFNTNALEWEDAIFLQTHYVDSLSSYMAAHGLTAEFFQSGTKEANLALNHARTYAITEAQKATYRDANAVANTLNRFKRDMYNRGAGGKVASVLLEGAVPFTKTPANILRRGVEYSPVGLAKGLTADLYKVKTGEFTASQAIDNIAAGLTGTGVMVLGMWLHSMGLLSGGGDDDKNQANFNKLNGKQKYALQIGDKSYTIDWLAPMSLPLFVGAEIDQMRQGEGMSSLTDYLDAFTGMVEPMVEMSMLQGINNTIKAASYGENALTSMMVELSTGYFGQAVPTALGQVARAIDPIRRDTNFVDKNSQLPAVAQKFVNRSTAKIPFASKTLPPMVDQWGRTQENAGGSFLGRLAANTLSPGYISSNKAGNLENELQRIYDATGESEVLPKYADKTIKYDDKTINLNAKQYTQYSTEKGQKAHDILNDIIGINSFDNMSFDQKADVAKKVYEYSNALAKASVTDYELSDSLQKIADCEKAGIPGGMYIVAYVAQKDIQGTKDSSGKTIALSASKNKKAAIDRATPFLSSTQKRRLYQAFGVSEQVW